MGKLNPDALSSYYHGTAARYGSPHVKFRAEAFFDRPTIARRCRPDCEAIRDAAPERLQAEISDPAAGADDR